MNFQIHTFFGTQAFALDALSALFAVIIALGGLSALVYSVGYVRRYRAERPAAHFVLHYVALALLIAAMLGVVTARGGYGFLICWELMTLASFVLILFGAGKAQVRRAALSYLVMMHVGFVFLVAGFATLGARGLPVSFGGLGEYFGLYESMPLFLLFLVGFGMKAGLFPLHTWLPEAHPAAPAHVSALMSGVMIKMGVYGVLRVVMAMPEGTGAGALLMVAGAVTGVWGVLLAAVSSDVKRMLAWSSIENIGIIFLGIGAGLVAKSALPALCAMGGALLHVVNHSFFKSLLFFGAGNIYTQTHTTSLEKLGGLGKKMPATALVFLVATIAICALPPLSGFVSELLIWLGFFTTLAGGGTGVMAAIGGVVALAFIGGVAIVAFAKLYGVVFLGQARSEAVAGASEVDGWRRAACAPPLLGILGVGLASFVAMGPIFEVAGQVLGVDDAAQVYATIAGDVRTMSLYIGVAVAIVVGLWLLRRALLRGRKVSAGPTWGCGFGAPDASMQYTGESFSEGLQSVAPHVAGKLRGSRVEPGEIFPDEHAFAVERRDRVAVLLGEWWMALWRLVNSRASSLRTGKVNHYVLYALFFLLLILLLSILGWL